MIQGIRRKFILIAVTVLAAVMIVLAAVINFSNWVNVRGEIQETLNDLIENEERGPNGTGKKGRSRHMQNTLEESRYFLVRLNGNGSFLITDVTRTPGKTSEELETIVRAALSSGSSTGLTESYMFLIRTNGSGEGTAVFLNCETKMDGIHRLLLISAVACAGGIGLAWLLVVLFSNRAVQPLIRNAVQQKQFITDAGHELKTPLTVISANMDALELNTAPNEWIDSTREQLSRMSGLVSNMIYLSRMDEDGMKPDLKPVCLSELVREETEPYQGMEEMTGKILGTETEEGLYVQGDPDALRRLIRQLCENAEKYAPEGDTIRFRLYRSGREILLTEENALREPLPEGALEHLFDRFYRPDQSRSREKGGFGIGLSMVRAIAEKHGGKIRAEMTPEGRIRFVCSLPAIRTKESA